MKTINNEIEMREILHNINKILKITSSLKKTLEFEGLENEAGRLTKFNTKLNEAFTELRVNFL